MLFSLVLAHHNSHFVNPLNCITANSKDNLNHCIHFVNSTVVVHYLDQLKLTSKKTVMDVSVMICAADCKCGECYFPMLRCYTNVIQINNYVYLANSLAKRFFIHSQNFSWLMLVNMLHLVKEMTCTFGPECSQTALIS